MFKKLLVSLAIVFISTNLSFANLCDDLSKRKLPVMPALEKGAHIEKEIEVEINQSPEEVSIWFDNLAPEKVIKGTDLVSGVKATCLVSEKPWGEIGSKRLVLKQSGSSFQEQVIKNIPQKYFAYRMWDFSKDVTHAIQYADAYFEVIEVEEHKSLLKWHISFRPSSFFYKIPLSLYLKASFDPFMKQSLQDIKNYIEAPKS